MSKALQGFLDDANRPIPQSKPEDETQIQNAAGGYTFQVSDQTRLERFLILGTDGGTYYVDQKTLTEDNAKFVIELIKRDAPLVINTLASISREGRALRQSPTIFTMALIFTYGNNEAKSVARSIFNSVIRTSTHLFEWTQYVESLGGWGRAKRSAVAGWYTGKNVDALAYQAVKYRQRGGWTHRDELRLSHPIGVDQRVGQFILGKDERRAASTWDANDVPIIRGFKFAQEAQTVSELLNIALTDYPDLPWEALPTQFLKEPEVWKKLFYNGQLNGQALVRTITRLSRINAFNDLVFARDYATRLVDETMIARTRLHPLNYLNALVVHQEGQIDRKHRFYAPPRMKDWTTVPVIVDALNEGFHRAFTHIEPANKRTMLALDVSGSMSTSVGMGLDLTAAQVTAAMSMATARTEPYYLVLGFADEFRDLGITPRQNFNEVLNRVQLANFGSTDCALPMQWALNTKTEIDTFCVYTDNETWAGRIHPHVALEEYRQKMGIDAKLAVVGITATEFTIAKPSDRGMVDLVGADSNLPKIIAEFSAGRI